MPEEPEAVETQTSETEAPPPESPEPNSSEPEAGQESGQEAAAPEEDGDENPPKERRSILLTVLYALVVLLIIAEGLVVCAWWSAVSRAQTEEARQAAWEADRSNRLLLQQPGQLSAKRLAGGLRCLCGRVHRAGRRQRPGPGGGL